MIDKCFKWIKNYLPFRTSKMGPYPVDSHGIIELTHDMVVPEDGIIELTEVVYDKPHVNDYTIGESRKEVAVIGTPYDVGSETLKKLNEVFYGINGNFIASEFGSLYLTDAEKSQPLLKQMGHDFELKEINKISKSMPKIYKNRYYSTEIFLTTKYKNILDGYRFLKCRTTKRLNHSGKAISLSELAKYKSELIQERFLSKMKHARY